MNIFTIISISLGLAMDSFAVTVGIKPTVKKTFELAAVFAFFHMIMPILGFMGGAFLGDFVEGVDHWIVFVILGIVGGKMIFEALFANDNVDKKQPVILLAIATSIDALTIGIGLPFMNIALWVAVVSFGITIFLVTMIAGFIGRKGAQFIGKYFEVFGGLILIFIGVKTLLSHLWF
ncbi:manganese efflux pump MntP family protein [Patescibacteria group bacterium]|nr:manganese efflux pump MntP family protein [Patescibacteria group bacterium]